MGGSKKKANQPNPNQQKQSKPTAAAKPAAKPETGQHKARHAAQNAGASAGLANPSSTNSSSTGSFGLLADGDESQADNDSSDAESAHDDNVGSRTDDDVHTGDGDGRAWGAVDNDLDEHDDDDGLAQDILRNRAKAPRQPGASLLSSGSPLESVLVAEVQKAAKAGEEPPAWVIKMLMPGAGHQNDIEKLQHATADLQNRISALENLISGQDDAFVASGAAYTGQQGRNPRKAADKRDRDRSRGPTTRTKPKVTFAKSTKPDTREKVECDFIGCKFSNLRFTHPRSECKNEGRAKQEGYKVTKK